MKKNILIFITAYLFISSCSSIQKINQKYSDSLISPNTFLHTQGNGDIKLLHHQLRPIDYLLKNPDLKGLLVNHYMGTGKTYLGLGFAQAYKSKKIIILAPKFLENNWLTSIEKFGVYKPERFIFISYEDAPLMLSGKNMSEYIILADEIHNLIKYMRSSNYKQNLSYTRVYLKLRSAYKILGLTGTPVYNDESDLAYLINLVSGQDLMPYNQESFRLKYTSIMTSSQFFRGYFLESNLFTYVFPIFSTLVLGAAFPFWGLAVGFPLGVLGPVGIRWLTPLEKFKLRKLDTNKMSNILSKYVSYFRFDEDKFKEFPAQDFKTEKVPYNTQQYSFFLHLVEGDLEVSYLQRLLENNKYQLSDNYVRINSTSIHEKLYREIGSGRDIGNFEFFDNKNKIIESPKFEKIYKVLTEQNEQTVIYSNYYETGTKAFAAYLKRKNYPEKYEIIYPGLNSQEVGQIVNNYNIGKTKLLLLHPDVTEGISLKGTQYLHFLEPVINPTQREQVIGRTRRFQSHTHLAKDKQVVKVRVWQSESSSWSTDLGDIYRANWYKRYRELSYMSLWGIGISQIDKKYDSKALNPEELAQVKLETLQKNLTGMQNALTEISIEKNYRAGNF